MNIKKFWFSLLVFLLFPIICHAGPPVPSNYQLNAILNSSANESRWVYDLNNKYTAPSLETLVFTDLKNQLDPWEASFLLKQSPIKVLKISNPEALNIVLEIIETIYPRAIVSQLDDYSTFSFNYWTPGLLSAVNVNIEPVLIQNQNAENDYGIVFKLSTFPLDYTFSSKFFRELDNYIKDRALTTKIYEKYKIHKDKGIVDVVAASIPITFAGFKNFLEDKQERLPFEGIWTTLDNSDVIGIVYVMSDPQFKYHAFIINSKSINWKPGEIKAKFIKLANGKLTTGEYFAKSKAQVGLTWKAEDELITALNAPGKNNIVLVKNYPLDDADSFSGVGTGWAITEDGIFVTNYHVIQHATKIFIGPKDKPVRAKILTIDKRNDLAILKALDFDEKVSPIPIEEYDVAPNGEDIVVIGYPLAFENKLGGDPRITSGIISAQSGYKKDVTLYQISAPIQPGNSGGPVIDSHGNSVGIVVSTYTGTDRPQAINFAIKSSYLASLIRQAGIKVPTLLQKKKMSAQSIFATYKKSILPVWTED